MVSVCVFWYIYRGKGIRGINFIFKIMVDRLKVDQTAIPIGQRHVLISNINIPLDYLRGQELGDILRRVNDFIDLEYTHNNPVYVEVSATYRLRHSVTNATRQWVGSFAPSMTNGPMILESEVYSRVTFINRMMGLLNVDAICDRLMRGANRLDSEWIFDQLFSIIIHTSSIVPNEYHILYRRHFGHGKRHSRKVSTFNLP